MGIGTWSQRRRDLGDARVHRADGAVGFAHHERVAEALDRRRELLALGLDPRLGALELLRHGVEGRVELPQLCWPARLDPL